MEEIKSSLLNDKHFVFVKKSLIEASEQDGKEKFRVKLLEYINDTSDNDDDEFFYEMLEWVRFLKNDKSSVAYTTPDHRIFLNAPTGGNANIGENYRQWDFIYDHECLHQAWDTFAVGEKIKSEGIPYNHYILNVASDCVINDYLYYYRKKDMPSGLITPEYLKEEYDIEYNRKYDTQYKLYLKLLEKKDELEKDERCQDQCGENSGESSGENSKGGSGSGNNQDKKEKDKDGNGKGNGNGEDKKDKDGKGNEKGNGNGEDKKDKDEKGNGNGEDKKDKDEKGNGNGEDKKDKGENNKKSHSNGDESKNDKGGNPNGNGEGSGSDLNEETDEDLKDLKKRAEDLIEKYKKKISGDLSNFFKKCISSQKLEEDGLMVKTNKATSSWNQKLSGYVNTYVKNKIFKKQREFKRTYQKVKRGSGFVKFGEPIQRGKKIKDDKLTISVAFYVDRSGSMSGIIDNVFDTAYIIAESLKKHFGKEKVVGDVKFKMITFDDKIEEIQWGKKVQARGGNLSMHDYLKKLEELTGDYLINIFITDGQFDIDKNEMVKLIKVLNGCLIYVTNQGDSVMKQLSKEYGTQIFYIEADSEFKIG